MAAGNEVTRDDAIYARYSTDLQNPRSVEDQIERARREIEKRGAGADAALVFTDPEERGGEWDRPGLQTLLRAVAEGRIGRIFVEDVDRVSRDPEDQARLKKILAFYEVRLISIAGGFELDGSSGSALAWGMKSLIAEQQIRDIGDKTRRGLVGNAREGKATGGRIYGYKAIEVGRSAKGTPVRRIEIDEEQAPVVRRIFSLYAEGHGYARIAYMLNREQIAPPRGPHARRVDELGEVAAGWMASCIREMLRNPKYVGDWSFGVREWRRHPETRRRVARKRAEQDVVRADRPELVILDRDLWDQVQARLAEQGTKYRARAVPHRQTNYLLSGILRCGCCDGPMQIVGGSTKGGSPYRYYKCSTNRKRGAAVCKNVLTVRETIARERIIEAIRQKLATPEAAAHVRKRIGEQLGALSRQIDAELAEREARLRRIEERIKAIIALQLDGDRSPYVAEMRRDFEAQAAAERPVVEMLRAQARAPIRLPAVDDLVQRVKRLDALIAEENVERGRDALRRYLKGGCIRFAPEDGHYVARAELLPLVMLLDSPDLQKLSTRGCAGRI